MTAVLDEPLTLLAAGFLTLTIGFAASRLAMFSAMLPDNPNARSSHSGVVSRAGGLAILAGWAAGVGALAVFSSEPALKGEATAFLLLGIAAGAVGLADDRFTLSPRIKAAGQIAVAAALIAVFGAAPSAPVLFVGEVDLGFLAVPLTLLWIVGFMNAFNFMDGINGLAGGAGAVGLAALSIICVYAGAAGVGALAILLAVACFSFLPANLGRGRLFMGDCGSHAIAFLVAGFGVAAASGAGLNALVAPVIFLPLIVDVVWTLGHRLARNRDVLTAHREHCYQLLVRMGASHARVAVLYMAATALSATGALIMLALPPAAQWAVPGALGAFFFALAMIVTRAGARAGLLQS